MGMLSARPEGPAEIGEKFFGRSCEPHPHEFGECFKPRKNLKFGAFWDLKIASNQCN